MHAGMGVPLQQQLHLQYQQHQQQQGSRLLPLATPPQLSQPPSPVHGSSTGTTPSCSAGETSLANPLHPSAAAAQLGAATHGHCLGNEASSRLQGSVLGVPGQPGSMGQGGHTGSLRGG